MLAFVLSYIRWNGLVGRALAPEGAARALLAGASLVAKHARVACFKISLQVALILHYDLEFGLSDLVQVWIRV